MRDDHTKNKGYKIAVAVLSLLLFISLGLLFIRFDTTEMKRLLLRSKSPDQTVTVSIYEKGSPAFFGPSTVLIYYGDDRVTVLDTEIRNDGATLNSSNYHVEWDGKTAIVTLSGEEQPDTTYRLSFGEKKKEGLSAPDKTKTVEAKLLQRFFSFSVKENRQDHSISMGISWR